MLSIFWNLCDFISPFFVRKWSSAKSTRKRCSTLTKLNLNTKRGHNGHSREFREENSCCCSTSKTRIKSNASFTNYKKKKTAKPWTLVEQVILGLKVSRFISNEVPINMVSHIDDIFKILATISNMQSSIHGKKLDWKNKGDLLRKKCPHSELFSSVFSPIGWKYGPE